jgi:hypothetical protein
MAVVAPIVGWLIPGGGHIPAEALWARHSAADFGGRDVPDWIGDAGTDLQAERRRHSRHLGFVGDVGAGALYFLARIMDWGNVMAANAAADYGKTFLIVAGLLELHRGGGCASHCAGEKTVSLNLSHFSAAVVFALFASVVFGITQRNSTMEQVKYGLYCFAMFVGGVFLAGWVMALIRR